MLSQVIPGRTGRKKGLLLRLGCLAARAAGAKAKTSLGNRCAPSWWSRSPTITCKAIVFATWPSSEDGAAINLPKTAPSNNLKSCRRKNCATSFAKGSENSERDVKPQLACTIALGDERTFFAKTD